VEIEFQLISISFLVLALASCVQYPLVANDTPKNPTISSPPSQAQADSKYKCAAAQRYAGNVVGDGHCVSLIKLCSGAPDTKYWRPGARVLSQTPGSIAPGAIIATFKNGRYPSRTGYHAAIYIKHDDNGIWVWDQWLGKPVHKRLIRVRNEGTAASNSAQDYRVVK